MSRHGGRSADLSAGGGGFFGSGSGADEAVGVGSGLDEWAVEGEAVDDGRASGTRLLELVNTMEPKLVAAAFRMDPETTMIHPADHVEPGRMSDA
uniref:hypothetical protein n=1 Tax=Streptomyces poriferorum TaxID=2798799 RepID=UPI00353237E9